MGQLKVHLLWPVYDHERSEQDSHSTRMPGATRCCFALRLPFLWLEVPIQGQFEGSPVSLVQGKMIFSLFLMFSTDEIYDTVLILCCCSTSVFRGDIKLCHWVSKGQFFFQNKMSKGCLYIPIYPM